MSSGRQMLNDGNPRESVMILIKILYNHYYYYYSSVITNKKFLH